MKEHTLHFLLACLLAILVYAVLVMEGKASEQEKLKFPTEQIREMWQGCSYNFQRGFPQIPQRIRWPLCDCYTDYLRENFSSLGVKTLSDNESKTVGLKIAKICVIPEDLLPNPSELFNKPLRPEDAT